jgi:hypothetical protein
MSKNEHLNPCPVCGGPAEKAAFWSGQQSRWYSVACATRNCIYTAKCSSEEHASEIWNSLIQPGLARPRWTNKSPAKDGWYWMFNGATRSVVVIKNNVLYLNEKDAQKELTTDGYPMKSYEDNLALYWIEIEPPEIPG